MCKLSLNLYLSNCNYWCGQRKRIVIIFVYYIVKLCVFPADSTPLHLQFVNRKSNQNYISFFFFSIDFHLFSSFFRALTAQYTHLSSTRKKMKRKKIGSARTACIKMCINQQIMLWEFIELTCIFDLIPLWIWSNVRARGTYAPISNHSFHITCLLR